MYKAVFFIITALLGLSGCVRREAVLVNPETHQQTFCSSTGWGWFGAPMAAHTQNRCLDAAYANGYQIAPVAAPVAATLVLPQGIPDAPTPQGWNVRLAKQKYKSGELTRVQYESLVRDLKQSYRANIVQAKERYRAGVTSRDQYKQEIRAAKYRYAG